MFRECNSLTSIAVGYNVTSISDYAFYNTAYYNDTNNWEDGVLYIGNYLIEADTSISGSYTIKSGTLLIASYALNNCSSLTSITIPNSVTSIGDNAFSGCSMLTSITIPDGVTSINEHTFSGCSSLESISIPDSVTSIGSYAFYNCSSLKSITIPDRVTSIGSWTLSGCSSLVSITLPFVGGSIKTSDDLNQYPFGYLFGTSSYTGSTATRQSYYASSTTVTTNTTYYIPSTLTTVTITGGNILYGAFYLCRSLTSITLPDSVTSIGSYAFFACSSLTSIAIPDSVTSIGSLAFYDCPSLTNITIPDSVTSIGDSAFSGCTSLENVYYSGTEEEWNAITISSGNSYLTSATITYNYSGDTEQGGTEQGDTEQGDTEQGSTEQGGTEQGDTEQGDTEQGGTEQGDTEQGGTEQGGTEQGGDTEETFTTYIDKTFEVFSGDMTYYKNDTTEWNGNAAAGFNTSTLTFAFNSDGTGTYYVNYSIGTTNIYEITVTFSYTVSECTVLDVDYTGSTGSFSGSRDFAGYKFTFTNCKFTQYSISGTDYLSSVTDADAATEMSKYAVGYNDSGIYVYGLDLGGVATAAETGTTIAYTMYGKLAEVTE